MNPRESHRLPPASSPLLAGPEKRAYFPAPGHTSQGSAAPAVANRRAHCRPRLREPMESRGARRTYPLPHWPPPPFRPPTSTQPLAEEVMSQAPCERIATHAAAWREGTGVLRQSRRRGAAAGEEQPLPPRTGPLGKAGVGKGQRPPWRVARSGKRRASRGWQGRGPLCPSGGANSVVLVSPGPAGPL